MATKNIVPRATGEGGLGTSSKLWKEVHHVTASFGGVSLISGSSNLQVSGGPLVAASGLSGSLTQLSNGSSYLVEGSNISITTGSAGQVTIASPHAGVIEDLNTLGASSADGEFIVATGAGAFAYESGATVRTSLGLGTGNSPTFTGLTLSGDLTVNGTTTTVDTTNLLVEDPVVLLGTGASSANSNGGLALLSGSSVAGNSLVIGRVANDTWGVGRKDVTGGSVTTLADMTLVDFKAAAITTSGNVTPSAADTYSLGSTSAEWANLYLGDSSYIYFGNDQDVKLQHVPDTGLKLELGTAGEGEPILEIASSADQASGPSLKLNMQKTANVNDVMGNIEYLADNDSGGDKVYGSITTSISNVGVDAIFTGDMKFNVVSSGSLHTALLISGSDLRQTGSVDIPGHNATDSGLMLGGTLVTSTAAELNLLDGATVTTTELNLLDGGANVASPTTTVVDADRFIINDNGTMTHVSASVLKSYIGGGGGLSNIVEDTTPQLGGTLDLNSQAIEGNLVPSAAGSYDLGSASAEWGDVYLKDSAKIQFGLDQDVHIVQNGDGLRIGMDTAGTTDPKFELYSTHDGNNGPELHIWHNSATPANLDTPSRITTYGENSSSSKTLYSSMQTKIVSNTAGSESGKVITYVVAAGSNASGLEVEGTSTSGVSTVNVPGHNGSTGGLKLAGTLVTATAAELNLLDGGTSATSTTVVDADRVILNDNGTMKQVAMSDIKTYTGGGGSSSGGGKFGLAVTTGSNFTTTAFASAEERQLYIVDSSNAVTATLASPGNTTYDGYEVNIKRFGAGAVHITGSAGVLAIDGSTTFDLPSQYSSVTLIATGSQFVIV